MAEELAERFEAYRAGIHPEDQDKVQASLQETLHGGKDYRIEYRSAVGTEQMVLPHDLRQRGRPQFVCKRPRCVRIEPRGGEQARRFAAAGALHDHPLNVTVVN
jgi:hypothetical protein